MVEFTSYPAGTPNWVDLATTDVDGASGFYADLFGWTTEAVPVTEGLTYTICRLRDRPVAAIFPLDPGAAAAGAPPHWTTCIAVDDVEEVSKFADKAGGTVFGEVLMSTLGRRLAVQDPSGAFFALWQPGTLVGSAFANEPGAFTWNELQTHDVDRSMEFYRDLFNWGVEVASMPDGHVYRSFVLNDKPVAGMMKIRPEWGQVPPNWGVYFAVDDCDSALGRVEELGGAIEVPATEISETGRFSLVTDPEGAYLYLLSGM